MALIEIDGLPFLNMVNYFMLFSTAMLNNQMVIIIPKKVLG